MGLQVGVGQFKYVGIHVVTRPYDGVTQTKSIGIHVVMGPQDGVDSPNEYKLKS